MKYTSIKKVLSICILSICAISLGYYLNNISKRDNEVLKELNQCPLWASLDYAESQKREQILLTLEKISKYDTSTIRLAIVKYINDKKGQNKYGPANAAQIYLLNRYIFYVPDIKAKDDDQNNTSNPWLDDERYLWPLSTDGSGNLRLTGKYQGFIGEGDRALQEFDYFNTRFGRRKILSSSLERS